MMQTAYSFNEYSDKRITFIISTKDRPSNLRDALNGAKKYVTDKDELIVVDGSTNEDSLQVASEFSDLIDNYLLERDMNNPNALNKGLLIARGQYIKNISDDDEFYPQAIEQAYKVMIDNPEIDFLVCGGTRIREGVTGYVYVPPESSFGKDVDEVYKYTRCGAGFFFKRAMLHQVGFFDVKSVSCDAVFILQSIKFKAVVRFCRTNMFTHELTADSLSVTDQEEKYLERDRLIRQYCSKQFQAKWFRRQKSYYKLLKWFWKQYKSIFTNNLTNNNSKTEPIWDGGLS